MLQQGMLVLASTFAANSEVLLNAAEVRLTADNCTESQQTAQANAITSARRNAAFIAKHISARLGSVTMRFAIQR